MPTTPLTTLAAGPQNVPGAATQFNNFLLELVHDGITAFATGGQPNATQITGQTARVSTVATAADSVMLPQALPGLEIILINKGANAMQVFGFSTDTINDVASGTGVSQMSNSVAVYSCSLAGKWYCEIGTGFSGSLVTDTYQFNITAHAGGTQAAAYQLAATINHISTVATAADSVVLPAWAGGLDILVINKGTKAMQVYGLGTDTIDDQTNTVGVSQMAGSTVLYIAGATGKWYTEGLATGFGGPGLQTLSFTPAMTADVAATQAGAIANALMTTMVNRVGTVATQGNGVALPTAVVGLAIQVINRGANAVQVFGNGTDTINGILTTTGISQGAATTATYVCNVAGNWEVPISALISSVPVVQSGDGAIPAHVQHTYAITKGSAAALTLAAPTSGTDDGNVITIYSRTAFAHVLTATGLLNTGSANHNTATWAAQLGGCLVLIADQGKWVAESQVGITFG